MNVLLIDPDVARRAALAADLAEAGLTILEAGDFRPDLAALAIGQSDAVITEAHLPTVKGSALVRAVHERRPALPVVMVTSHGYVDEAVGFCKAGAFDVLIRPLDEGRVAEVVVALKTEADSDGPVDDQQRWDALMREATHAVQAHRYGLARRLVRILIGQRPDAAAAINLLGTIIEREGDQHSAQSYYRAALAFDATYRTAQENLYGSGKDRRPPLIDPEFADTDD